jgi:hypothetical protein
MRVGISHPANFAAWAAFACLKRLPKNADEGLQGLKPLKKIKLFVAPKGTTHKPLRKASSGELFGAIFDVIQGGPFVRSG